MLINVSWCGAEAAFREVHLLVALPPPEYIPRKITIPTLDEILAAQGRRQ